MKKRSEKMWVIVNDYHGLYVGSALTRARMISEHVSDRYSGANYDGVKYPVMSPTYGAALNDDHRFAWAKAKKSGDRCVRATVSW